MTAIRQVQGCRASVMSFCCAPMHCNMSCSICLRAMPQCLTRTSVEGRKNPKLYPPIELGLHSPAD